MDRGRCSPCGAEILWGLTEGLSKMPLNPDPSEDGNVVLRDVGGFVRLHVLTGAELPAQEDAYVPHHRTCKYAAEYRRRKGITTAKCLDCRQPLHQLLVDRGRKYHWLCGPDPNPALTRRLALEAAARERPQPQLDLEEAS